MENEESQASEDCSLLTEICVKESDCETEEKPKKRWFQQPFTWLIIVISFIILLLIGYFLIIPLIINSVIKHAPPIQVQNVAFVKLNRNKTLQMVTKYYLKIIVL